jgi:hypothetical protein
MAVDLNGPFVPVGLGFKEKEAVHFLVCFHLKGIEIEAGL